MKTALRRILLPTAVATVFALAIFPPGTPPALGQNARVQTIEVTAKKYEYSPAPIHVKSKTKIQLKITAIDHDHGFSIATVPDADSNAAAGLVFDSAQECWQLKKGETATIEFLARTPGTYSFKCCHTCGLGHRDMKGLLIVEP
jgi:heme/copper-type cytochrome/quinol oxidase subunit 2